MYCDRTDLAVCGSTHIRAPYAGAGSNDVVHSPFFQVTAGIFPDQAGFWRVGKGQSRQPCHNKGKRSLFLQVCFW